MPIAYWCILAAVILPYLAVGPSKADPAYDNALPREVHKTQTGFRLRAYGAHVNGLEVFPFFAAAVLVAGQFGAQGRLFDGLALAWVAIRIIYTVAYIAGLPTLRSALWGLSLLTAIAIFTLPAWS